MLRILAAAALATSVVAVAAPASAQERENTRRPMGLRLEAGWAGRSNLATVGSGPANSATTPLLSPNGDIKIGYDLGQFTPLIGISFANRSIDTGVNPDTSISTTVFILDLEARYYLAQHRKGLQPFVFGEFNTAFVNFSSDPEPEGAAKDALDDAESAANFTEINAGFGLEYKFDGAAFAIGGKWGLGLAFQGRDVGDESFSDDVWGTVAGIYAAWRL